MPIGDEMGNAAHRLADLAGNRICGGFCQCCAKDHQKPWIRKVEVHKGSRCRDPKVRDYLPGVPSSPPLSSSKTLFPVIANPSSNPRQDKHRAE